MFRFLEQVVDVGVKSVDLVEILLVSSGLHALHPHKVVPEIFEVLQTILTTLQ